LSSGSSYTRRTRTSALVATVPTFPAIHVKDKRPHPKASTTVRTKVLIATNDVAIGAVVLAIVLGRRKGEPLVLRPAAGWSFLAVAGGRSDKSAHPLLPRFLAGIGVVATAVSGP
jgi:hypothetical protein